MNKRSRELANICVQPLNEESSTLLGNNRASNATLMLILQEDEISAIHTTLTVSSLALTMLSNMLTILSSGKVEFK